VSPRTSWAAATVGSHPSARYRTSPARWRWSRPATVRRTPIKAPAQAIDTIATLHDGRRARRAMGVKLPAMSTKIMEWSRCFITRSARGDHERRWYAALVPYTALRLTAKIAAPT
jgi:hypothetical protein